ncbi:hypothetical protein QFZ52_001283 [Arthrobacter woluwensis]|uniref:hypothetical protein n=1 Tax=Arthrobacter woluwensis TaxID=156980 RepID=UPI00277D944A|nr:hypothetical protein [Arthrobacter woluwensis]MDQ0708631.1 hypothetical protein [Arthrobacter woluwensis]
MDFPTAAPPGRQTLLRTGQPFSRPELNALVLDGLVQPLSQECFVPGTAVVDARLRARALAESIPLEARQRVVAGRLSAAWIHGHGREPARPVLYIAAGRRAGALRHGLRAELYDVRLGDHDVVSLGGLLVTTPLRTALDIASSLRPELAVPVLRSMLHDGDRTLSWRVLRLAVEHAAPLRVRDAALAKVDACVR